MSRRNSAWLHVHQGDAPLIVAFPHTGTDLADVADAFASPWRARHDTDWYVDRLYDVAASLGATTVRTAISRSVVDVNRDPSGTSLYPGQETTELVPTTTFDGDPLYADPPAADEVKRRCATYFQPYHDGLAAEIARLQQRHDRVVLFDAHSIRSRIPRLFDGTLPQFNVGTNGGETCDSALTKAVLGAIAGQPAGDGSVVLNGRFKGGWTTRHYCRPGYGVHAIQLELAIRGYLPEPDALDEANWPPAYDPAYAAPMAQTLDAVLTACLDFAR